MTIYTIDEKLKRYHLELGMFESEIKLIEPQILLSKRVYLIDIFDTCVSPSHINEEMIPKPEFKIREGFVEFLDHYRSKGKIIGLHTDSICTNKFNDTLIKWGLVNKVDKLFGYQYMIFKDPKTQSRILNSPINGFKDFEKMTSEMGIKMDQALVIGDGLSEKGASKYFGIDLLLIPPYRNKDFNFSFKELIYPSED